MNRYCSFAKGNWEFFNWIDSFGPVLVCDTHGQPACGDVYECAPGHEIGLCQPEAEYVLDHTGFYGQDLIGREVVVDTSRCRCGRPIEVCSGRKSAEEVLNALRQRQNERVS